MDRRRFLTTSAGTLGTSLVVPRFLCAAADEFPDLVFAKGAPRDAVGRALETLGGIGRFVKDGDVVAIKPNASFPTPPTIGATTHPEVIGAIIEQVLSAGARRVLVVDHALGQAKRCFARCGLDKAVNAFTKAKLVTLDQQKAYQPVEVPSGKALKKTEVASIVQKADVLINVPTAKAHSATRVSFGLKNLMGLVWDRNTFHNDMDVHAGIADLATVIRADLTIVDAMYILMDNGPTGPGKVDNMGAVIAGIDPVAVDAYAVGLSTWDQQTLKPNQIAHLRLAAEQGVGTLDLSTLKIEELA